MLMWNVEHVARVAGMRATLSSSSFQSEDLEVQRRAIIRIVPISSCSRCDTEGSLLWFGSVIKAPRTSDFIQS